MTSFDLETQADYKSEKLVAVRRTSKVAKGGRKFGFSALSVVGDGKGEIGYGTGKGNEVSLAINKANEAAKRNRVRILLNGNTIQHEIIGQHGSTKVFMKPASEGTGVIAGNAARAVFEVMGIKDILSKVIGSTNPINVVKATIKGLRAMASPESIAEKRGKTVKEILG